MQQPAGGGAWLAERFEQHRGHLWAVAYRMLGSLPDADDAVQEAWVRFSHTGADGVENLGGWLTTILARICLNMLRARAARPEQPAGVHVPDPIVSCEDAPDPEQEALLAESVGLALLVVLDTLAPAERLAFVLHDIFQVPFEDIAPMVGRSPIAARQLASRARRRVQAAGAPTPDAGLAAQRAVVDAFFTAARTGDFGKLVALLDPDVVLRADGGPTLPQASALIHGAAEVAKRALLAGMPGAQMRPVLVNGAAITVNGRPVTLMAFAVTAGKISAIDGITDPERLARLDLATDSN
jgi:RNA polymerase sigma factor (sigma-70 family)